MIIQYITMFTYVRLANQVGLGGWVGEGFLLDILCGHIYKFNINVHNAM